VGLVNFVVVRVRTYTHDWVQSVKEEEETITVLVELGGDVHAQTPKDRRTPLHRAAQEGCLATVKLLVEMGGDVHAQSTDGLTPLHLATFDGQTEIVKLLVELRGDVRA
jgi:ankyrin repeat protein